MKKWTAAALAALTALTLTGCSFQDVMLYLYGGDSFVTSAEPDYTTCDGDNGVTVLQHAGAALKQAKRVARGKAIYFEPEQADAARVVLHDSRKVFDVSDISIQQNFLSVQCNIFFSL